MKIFDSFSIRIALLTRLQSSSSSWPVRRRVALTRPLEEIRRSASWLADISIENTATAFLVLIAAYSAMLSAQVVLPMAASAARISRLVGCRPTVIFSNSVYPVGLPALQPPFVYSVGGPPNHLPPAVLIVP